MSGPWFGLCSYLRQGSHPTAPVVFSRYVALAKSQSWMNSPAEIRHLSRRSWHQTAHTVKAAWQRRQPSADLLLFTGFQGSMNASHTWVIDSILLNMAQNAAEIKEIVSRNIFSHHCQPCYFWFSLFCKYIFSRRKNWNLLFLLLNKYNVKGMVLSEHQTTIKSSFTFY